MRPASVEFRILGPLVVALDGAAVPTGGPKQRGLLALLLLSANRVVSRDRLIEELFAGQSLNSADHALRNHVSRLRKVLAPMGPVEPRIVARPPGYLLRVEPGELDLERFERLLEAGREALAAGDPAPAAELLRSAEALWRGRPLADLEFEPFVRVDVERLEELRLAAVEERINAELALGRHAAVVPELEALVAEHPFREGIRAQLMLALYRAGRQAEGLEVYRRTRTLLSEELGLEPGVELQALERAILVQDSTLDLPVEARRHGLVSWPREVCPFKGLEPFSEEDADVYFGREQLVEEILARLRAIPVLALVGPSGSGKSSLLRAGLLPALGDASRRVVLRPGLRPAAALQRELGGSLAETVATLAEDERIVVAIDQLEEVFAEPVGNEERRAFLDDLVDAAWDPYRRVAILLALRADLFGRLGEHRGLADLVAPNHVLLGPLTSRELRRAIEGPAGRAGLEVEANLVDALVEEVAGEAGGLPLLSATLFDLWSAREGRTLTLAAYERSGGVRGAVARHAEAALRSLPAGDGAVVRRIMLRLVEGEGGSATRRRASSAELGADEDGRVGRVISALVERRLLVAGEGSVELVHEALLSHWPRLVGWLEEEAEGRRLHAHLRRAAADWDTGGRDLSELYRGPRLAAVLDWAGGEEQPPLSPLEHDFLGESRAQFTRDSERQRRLNRRLRALLALASGLLLVALAVGALAGHEWRAARGDATRAVAQRLGAQALVEPRLDRALLLAREAVALDDSEATRANLLGALLRSPAAIAVLPAGPARVLDGALGPGGRTLVVRNGEGRVSFFDTTRLRAVGPAFVSLGQIDYFGAVQRPVRAVAVDPATGTVAVGDSDGMRAAVSLLDPRTHHSADPVLSYDAAVTVDAVFSPDGRMLVTGEAVNGIDQPPPEILVARSPVSGVALRHSPPFAGGRLIGFTRDGRFLLVTTGARALLLDSRTFRHVREYRVAGVAAVSPAADVAAFGGDDGGVTLVDLGSGAARRLTGGAEGPILALAFSGDGRTIVATTQEGAIAVVDVRTGTLVETLTGGAQRPVAPVFSPDSRTLYTAAGDGTVTAWDIRADRRLGRVFRFSPLPTAGEGPPAARDAAKAVAVSPDRSIFATSPGRGRVTLWRAEGRPLPGELRGPFGDAQSLVFSHTGRFLAAAGSGSQAVVWDVAARSVARVLPVGTGANAVAFSPDDGLVATAGADGAIRVFDSRTGRSVGLEYGPGTLQDLDFSVDGTLLAATGLSGDVLVWGVSRRKLLRTIPHGSGNLTLRFSPDGREVAAGDFAGEVHFWDPRSGRELGGPLGGHEGVVVSISFAPSGELLATTSADGRIRLWSLPSRRLVGAALPAPGVFGWGTFFPDGAHFVSVFPNGTGVIWDTDPSAWEEHACRVAHRNLTRAEWRDFLPRRGYRATCGAARPL